MSAEALVAALDAAAGTADRPEALAHTAERLLTEHLAAGLRLAARFRQPDPDRYRQHLVHVGPHGRYSLVALVWLPGQYTPIHDHVAWCVSGVLVGSERETRYRLAGSPGRDEFLVATGTRRCAHGEVGILVPPAQNIHHVTNCGADLAISLHIYGADIGVLGSSVNHVFDLPVRPEPGVRADPVPRVLPLGDAGRHRAGADQGP